MSHMPPGYDSYDELMKYVTSRLGGEGSAFDQIQGIAPDDRQSVIVKILRRLYPELADDKGAVEPRPGNRPWYQDPKGWTKES